MEEGSRGGGGTFQRNVHLYAPKFSREGKRLEKTAFFTTATVKLEKKVVKPTTSIY